VFSNLERRFLCEKTLKFFLNSFLQVANYFFKLKNGNKSPKKNTLLGTNLLLIMTGMFLVLKRTLGSTPQQFLILKELSVLNLHIVFS